MALKFKNPLAPAEVFFTKKYRNYHARGKMFLNFSRVFESLQDADKYQGVYTLGIYALVNDNYLKKAVTNKQDRFPFNSLIQCKICGCKVIGGTYKKKYRFYHCTFSNGKHDGYKYLREDRLAELMGKALEKAIPPDTMLDYIAETIRKDSGTSQEYAENRLKSLFNDRKTLETRIGRLYDDKLDNKITEAFWQAKDADLKRQLSAIEAELRELSPQNPKSVEKGLTALELVKGLMPQYKNGDLKKKAEILKTVHSNFLYDGEKLSPVCKKPFDVFAEGLSCHEWRKSRDDLQNLISEFNKYSGSEECYITYETVRDIQILHNSS